MTRIRKRLLKSFLKKQKQGEVHLQESQNIRNQQFVGNLNQNEQVMKELFRNCSDVIYRPIQIHEQTKVLLIYIDGMVDTKSLEETVLKPLTIKGSSQGLSQLESFEELILTSYLNPLKVAAIS